MERKNNFNMLTDQQRFNEYKKDILVFMKILNIKESEAQKLIDNNSSLLFKWMGQFASKNHPIKYLVTPQVAARQMLKYHNNIPDGEEL